MGLLQDRNADLGPTVDTIEGHLYTFANATGLAWGAIDQEVYWSRRPIIHVAEFLFFNLVCYGLHLLTSKYYRQMTADRYIPTEILKSCRFDKFLGYVFILFFLSQVAFKGVREKPLVQLCWCFMPCHLITLVWAYICLCDKSTSKSRGVCILLATMCASFHWGPLGAAALPDRSDHLFPPYEGYVFDVHHALLGIMPFYWACRYQLLPMSWSWLAYTSKWGIWIAIGPYTVIGYIAGLNLYYMLAPPAALQRKIPQLFDTPLWRCISLPSLILMTAVCRSIIGFVGWLFKKLTGRC